MSPRTLGASIPSSSSCETNINGSVVTCVVNSKDARLLLAVRNVLLGIFCRAGGRAQKVQLYPIPLTKRPIFTDTNVCVAQITPSPEGDRVIFANHHRINTLKRASKSRNSGNFREFKSSKSQ